MINEAYDKNSRPLIDPLDAIPDKVREAAKGISPDVIIVVFSHKLIRELLETGKIMVVNEDLHFGSAAGQNPLFQIKGSNIFTFLCGVGAPAAVACIEELHAVTGCRRFLVFGSCGTLVDIPPGKVIVPTRAYRDEGCSYHYVQASDYITIRNAEKLMGILDELQVEYVAGGIWSTDAFYRETLNKRDQRVQEGCLCVDMECSAVQAVCDYRQLELYQFVYGADSLAGSWSKRILGDLEMDSRLAYFSLAEQIAARI